VAKRTRGILGSSTLPGVAHLKTGDGKPATKTTKTPASKGKKPNKAERMRQEWSSPDKIRVNVSRALGAMLDDVKASGDDLAAFSIGEAHKLIAGVPLPGLAFEYLIQNNVWPLGRVSQVLGTEGSFKSQFSIELARIFIEHGGGCWLGEHESKMSPDWISSTIGWDRQESYKVQWCDSMDEWQKYLQEIARRNKRFMMGTKSEPGPGAVYPLLFVVDSIMGKAMIETQERVESAGVAGRDFPLEAKSLTVFMRTFPQRIARWPFHFMMINHLRPKKVQGSNVPERDRAGGRGKEFQESFEIEMEKAGKIVTTQHDGVRVKIKVYKNSLGITGRQIYVNLRWWQEDDPEKEGGWRQVTQWDWDEATVELLAGERGLPAEEKVRIRGILDLSASTKTRKASSKRIGVSKDNPVSWSEMGRLIHENTEVMQELRRAFGIKMRNVFRPGEDYLEQLLQKKYKIAERFAMYRFGQKKDDAEGAE
jgi:RecA/RadA recombinase